MLSKAERSAISKLILARPEVLAKVSAAAKGRIFTKDHREALSRANHSRSAELVGRIASKLRGKNHSDEHKLKIGLTSRGRKHSAETKMKIGAKQTGPTSETMVKILESRKLFTEKRRQERTHFVCKVHGPIPLIECYARIGQTRYECSTCRKERGAKYRLRQVQTAQIAT